MTAPLLWAATITLLIGLFYFYTAMRVGVLRGRHNIKAPAISGHPEFDRAYRVQLNTLEQMGIFLPFLWVAALFPIHPLWIAPLIGIVWIIGRIVYLQRYMANPDSRLLGAAICGLTAFAMFLVAACGVLRVWLVARA